MLLALFPQPSGGGGGGGGTTGSPIGLLLALTQEVGGGGGGGTNGTPIGLLLALTVTGTSTTQQPTGIQAPGFWEEEWRKLAKRSRRKKEQEAVEEAIDAAQEAVAEAQGRPIDLTRLRTALAATEAAKKPTEVIRSAHLATQIAQAILRQIEDDDEEEAITLLLH